MASAPASEVRAPRFGLDRLGRSRAGGEAGDGRGLSDGPAGACPGGGPKPRIGGEVEVALLGLPGRANHLDLSERFVRAPYSPNACFTPSMTNWTERAASRRPRRRESTRTSVGPSARPR